MHTLYFVLHVLVLERLRVSIIDPPGDRSFSKMAANLKIILYTFKLALQPVFGMSLGGALRDIPKRLIPRLNYQLKTNLVRLSLILTK